MNNGVYTDLSINEYHANTTHLSATSLKIARRSLKEFDWYRRGLMPRDEKSSFDFGNAFELALLSPVEFSERVAIPKDSQWIAEAMAIKDYDKPRNSSPYQERLKEFKESNKGKYVIAETGPESYETIKHMLASAYADIVINTLIKNIEYQMSLFWTDQESGLNLKTRPDICKTKKNIVVNVKTIEDGHPQSFSRDLAKYEYPLQACLEIRGCIESGLMPSVDEYYWLVFEKKPPYCATLYRFDESDIRAFDTDLQYLLNRVAKAQDQELYPGYSDKADNQWGILKAEIPMYYRMLS